MRYSLMPGSTRLNTKQSLGSLKMPKGQRRKKLRNMFSATPKQMKRMKAY